MTNTSDEDYMTVGEAVRMWAEPARLARAALAAKVQGNSLLNQANERYSTARLLTSAARNLNAAQLAAEKEVTGGERSCRSQSLESDRQTDLTDMDEQQ